MAGNVGIPKRGFSVFAPLTPTGLHPFSIAPHGLGACPTPRSLPAPSQREVLATSSPPPLHLLTRRSWSPRGSTRLLSHPPLPLLGLFFMTRCSYHPPRKDFSPAAPRGHHRLSEAAGHSLLVAAGIHPMAGAWGTPPLGLPLALPLPLCTPQGRPQWLARAPGSESPESGAMTIPEAGGSPGRACSAPSCRGVQSVLQAGHGDLGHEGQGQSLELSPVSWAHAAAVRPRQAFEKCSCGRSGDCGVRWRDCRSAPPKLCRKDGQGQENPSWRRPREVPSLRPEGREQ